MDHVWVAEDEGVFEVDGVISELCVIEPECDMDDEDSFVSDNVTEWDPVSVGVMDVDSLRSLDDETDPLVLALGASALWLGVMERVVVLDKEELQSLVMV